MKRIYFPQWQFNKIIGKICFEFSLPKIRETCLTVFTALPNYLTECDKSSFYEKGIKLSKYHLAKQKMEMLTLVSSY